MFIRLSYYIDSFWEKDLILRDKYDFKKLIENFNNFKRFYKLDNKHFSIAICLIEKILIPETKINFIKRCFISKNKPFYSFYRGLDTFTIITHKLKDKYLRHIYRVI